MSGAHLFILESMPESHVMHACWRVFYTGKVWHSFEHATSWQQFFQSGNYMWIGATTFGLHHAGRKWWLAVNQLNLVGCKPAHMLKSPSIEGLSAHMKSAKLWVKWSHRLLYHLVRYTVISQFNTHGCAKYNLSKREVSDKMPKATEYLSSWIKVYENLKLT